MKKIPLILAFLIILPLLAIGQTSTQEINYGRQTSPNTLKANGRLIERFGEVKKWGQGLNATTSSAGSSPLKKARRFFSAKFSAARNERINQYSESMISKLDNAIIRTQEKIDLKKRKIAELETQGIEVSKARGRIAEAEKYLNEARTKLNDLPEKIKDTVNSNDPKASFPVVRENVKEIINNIRRAHDKTVMSLRFLPSLAAIKNLASSSQNSASSTLNNQ